MLVYFSRDLDIINCMETFNQELAIKVFDHFFIEKHKVKGFIIFSREVDCWFIDNYKNAFGINVVIDGNKEDYNGYSLFEIFDVNSVEYRRRVSSFHLIEQDPDQEKFIIQNHLKEIASDQFPDFLKTIIVKTSLNGQTLTGVRFLNFEGIIPKASSLEELAIKMELEK